MKNRLLIILIAIAFVGCGSDYETNNMERADDSIGVAEMNLDSAIGKESEITGTVIPFIGEFNIEEMNTDSFHEYGAGDCGGKIILKSYPHVALGIDSNWCGEYGFEFTNYVMTKEHTLTAIHSFEYFINGEDSIGRNYVLSEKIYDFNTEPLTIYLRKKYVLNEIKFNGEKFSELTINNRDSVHSFWNDKLKETWVKELD